MTRPSRISLLLAILPLGWMVSNASGARPNNNERAITASLRSLGVIGGHIGHDDDEPWKAKEDWWKDPLAMFGDEEEDDEEMEEEHEQQQQEDEDDEDGLEAVIEANMTRESFQEEDEEECEDELMIFGMAAKPALVHKQGIRKNKSSRLAAASSSAPLLLLSKLPKASAMAAPAMALLSKLPKMLDGTPVVQVLSAAVVVKFVVHFLTDQWTNEIKDNTGNEDDFENQAGAYPDESMDAEGAGQAMMEPRDVPMEQDEYYREDRVATERPDDTAEQDPFSKRRRLSFGIPSVLRSAGKRLGGKRRALTEEVEELGQKAKAAEMERLAMEREYEQRSFQLQETQAELATLATTTRYLKAQLRDNEEVMNRAIRAERSKAKAELTKMKDAMLKVLEKERRSMRDELRRQTNELQEMLEGKFGDDNTAQECVDT